ncbi:ATP-binding cassette domain-containing protein [Gloeobacter kilaueensis]|uniref:ABC transporter n=1 Tax=Gloeobacter kilaueensis (strain ATCC BAA-2537 / CCAP 1431/1 / ULC 316 / JS1) TaxID=1183438 RepID=U5QNF6_GLOK1|nr:ATP-binding cassette domain-containing protein [Gloeobacter kilaueensis]AGY60398.1 ABC transporter [Gloeobacter kilaueensis JS1]
MVTLRVRFDKRLGNFALAVDFAVEAGLVALFGPNGSGKSSTLLAIAGLLHPERGAIYLGEQVLFDSERRIDQPVQARRVGFVFQNYALFPHLNVARNICFGIERAPAATRRQKLAELLALLQLDGLQERLPLELSGGQRQRVAIARALAPEPQLLLLDEPFAAVDSALREQLREELLQLQQKLQLPVLMVSHARDEVLQLASTVVCLEAGSVSAVGPPAMVLERAFYLQEGARFSW